MKQVQKTQAFVDYIKDLRDKRAEVQISERVLRLGRGNAGDHKRLGEYLMELRIREGKGYRVYYIETDDAIIVLWAGHKGTQSRDIRKALALLEKEDLEGDME